MRPGRIVLALLTSLTLLVIFTGSAQGHALLLRSDPATGVPTGTPPRMVSLWFSEPVQVAFNSVAVVDSSNRRVDELDAHVSAIDPTRVDVSLGELAESTYVVRWQVTSADSHVVSGTTWFPVGFALTPPPVSALVGSNAASVAAWEVAGRWLVYLASLCLAGAPLFRRLVWPNMDQSYLRLDRRVAVIASGVLLVGQLLWLAAQLTAVSGTDFTHSLTAPVLQVVLLGSRFAVLWWLRLLIALPLVWLSRSDTSGVVLGVVLLASISLGSHANGVPVASGLLVLNDLVHLGAAAIWIGGLLQLLLLVRAARPEVMSRLVPRVSRAAIAAVTVLIVTGVVAAWQEIQTVTALLSTPYGQTLLVKICLVAVLLVFGAVNRLVMRPRFARMRGNASALASAFAALVLAEVTFGAGVLVAAGLLTSLPPPGQQPRPVPVQAARQADDLHVTLTADPDWVGVSHFIVALQDGGQQPPANIQSVTLTFTMQGMNMGRTNVTATRTPDNTYEASGYFVGMPGVSEVGVGVQRSGAPDESAVFQIEVPDVTQSEYGGLRASAGLGVVGVFGAGLALVSALALTSGWRVLVSRARALTVSSAVGGLLCGAGLVLADGGLALGEPALATANPVAPTTDSLSRGKALYVDHCQVCHGETGVGNGPAAAALLPPPADLTLHARWHGDPQLFWFVTNGVAGTAMAPFAGVLSERDRWDVLNYLHQLAEAPTATVPVAPAAPTTITASPVASEIVTPRASSTANLSGRIVYGPDTDRDFWVIQLPDGEPHKITSFGRFDFASMPAWSPDSSQIAYAFYQLPSTGGIPLPPGTDLYVMNADGTDQRMLAMHDVPGAVLQTPLWSPDGAALYVSYQAPRPNGGLDIGIDRIDARTGARTRVVPNAIAPGLSRNGQHLAYAALPSATVRSYTLWRSDVDGGAQFELIGPNVFMKFQSPRFSPDGQHLLFAAVGNPQRPTSAAGLDLLRGFFAPEIAYADGELWDMWTIDVDGRNLHRLTAINEDLPISAWSPEGHAIAYLGGGSSITAEAGVTVIDATTGSLVARASVQPGHRGLDWTR